MGKLLNHLINFTDDYNFKITWDIKTNELSLLHILLQYNNEKNYKE